MFCKIVCEYGPRSLNAFFYKERSVKEGSSPGLAVVQGTFDRNVPGLIPARVKKLLLCYHCMLDV